MKTIAELEKAGLIRKASALETPQVIRSGSLGLDWVLGRGWLRGGIHLLVGLEGSGKSTVALQCCLQAIKDGGRAIVIDLERGLWVDRLAEWNLTLDDLHIATGFLNLEEAYDTIIAAIGHYDVIVVDSLSAISNYAEAEASIKEKQYAIGAREVNSLIRHILAKINRVSTQRVNGETVPLPVVILISQVRSDLSTGGRNEWFSPVGGHGVRHYAHIWLDFRVAGVVHAEHDFFGKQIVAIDIQVFSRKNKIAPPFRRANLRLVIRPFYNLNPPAIDPVYDILAFGEFLGVIKRRGAWFELDDGEKVQGAAGFYKLDPDTIERLKNAVWEKLQNLR